MLLSTGRTTNDRPISWPPGPQHQTRRSGVRRLNDGTDEQTDARQFHKPCSAYYNHVWIKKGKGSPYSITKRRVPELIPVLGSQLADDVSHKPGGRLL